MILYPPPAQPAAGALLAANNLSEIASAAAARTALDVFSKSEAAARRNALAPRSGIAFDGTAGSRVTATLTNQNIGTDDFSVSQFLDIPLSILANTFRCIWALSSVGTGSLNVASAINAFLGNPGNQLTIEFYGASGGDRRNIALDVTPWLGKRIHLVLTRAGTTVKLYVNGVDTAYNTSTAGTPPAFSMSVTSTYLTVGARAASEPNTLISGVACTSLYNCALSPADVLEIYELGGAVPFRFQFGSQVEADLFTNPSFEADTASPPSGWTAAGNHVATAVADGSAPDGARVCEIVASGAGDGSTNCLGQSTPGASRWGKRFRFWFFAKSISGNTTLKIGPGGGHDEATFTLDGTYQKCVQEITQLSAPFGMTRLYIAGAGTFRVDSIHKLQIGAVVHLPMDDGLGFQLLDISTNRLHALMSTSGVSHIAPSYGPARFRAKSNTNGNQQLGGQVVIPANAQITRIRARAQSNTPTVTLGTASGGNQVVASVALSTSWKELTIALTSGLVGASNISLWAGSNSTDVVEWDITWEPLSA